MQVADYLGPGDTVVDWTIEREAHPGRRGTYLAHHAKTGAVVTLQVWYRTAATERAVGRLVELLKMLDHPALPRLVEWGDDPTRESLWVATEAFEGEPLADLLRERRLDWRDCANALYDLAGGLAQLHNFGWIHRDIHPETLQMGPDGQGRLLSLELAIDLESLDRQASAGLDTPLAYTAPEVIADPRNHGPRADLYSLGVVFYEALTGTSAFPAALWGDNVEAGQRLLEWKTRAKALDPSQTAPAWLAQLIRKATDPNPERRLPDLDAMVGWLEAAQGSWAAPVLFAPPPRVEPPAAPAPLTLSPSLPPAPLPPPPVTIKVQASALSLLLAGLLGAIFGLAFSATIILLVAAARA